MKLKDAASPLVLPNCPWPVEMFFEAKCPGLLILWRHLSVLQISKAAPSFCFLLKVSYFIVHVFYSHRNP